MTNLHNELISWYQNVKRDLPWRNNPNPYFVWISEIILQQTRVDQGLPYYIKFIERYPNVQELANATEQDVLSNWQGLGYYSRARNLHETAKVICYKFNGVFPDTYAELLKLKGVGKYTAAAIASFCFDEPVAVLDGNVFRVLSRLYDIDLPINVSMNHKIFESLANELIDKSRPATYNQAIMEFGALQCKPSSPNCGICPLRIHCLSFKNNTVKLRPLKIKTQKIKERYFIYWIIEKNGSILLRQRQDNDVWKKMFEFPMTEFESKQIWESKAIEKNQCDIKPITHILSHQRIQARFLKGSNEDIANNENMEWVKWENLSDYPLHRLMTKHLDTAE